MNKMIAPKGTSDIYTPVIAKWQFLENKIRQYFNRFLYKEIRTPIFEYSELFQRGIGSETEVVQKEMYTFLDKGGRSLTLRPENTASVVRAMIENNLLNEIFPLRFFYIGPMFRYDKPQKGRFRQFHQFGIEVLNDPGPKVDAEVIFSGYYFLKEIGIEDIQLHINSVGCPACRPSFLRELSQQAQNHEKELCTDCQRKINTNPLRIFDCKNENCIQIANNFPQITDYLCDQCGSHFEEVKSSLATLETEYHINPKLVRGLDYYCKTAFEITSARLGAQDAILGGGRYDALFKELGGVDTPAIGFAAGMERIILHLPGDVHAQGKIIFVAFQNPSLLNNGIGLIKQLWHWGYQAYMDYNGKHLKKQLKKSDRMGADFTFILGEDEIKHQQISVKHMASQQQETIKNEELEEWLKKNI